MWVPGPVATRENITLLRRLHRISHNATRLAHNKQLKTLLQLASCELRIELLHQSCLASVLARVSFAKSGQSWRLFRVTNDIAGRANQGAHQTQDCTCARLPLTSRRLSTEAAAVRHASCPIAFHFIALRRHYVWVVLCLCSGEFGSKRRIAWTCEQRANLQHRAQSTNSRPCMRTSLGDRNARTPLKNFGKLQVQNIIF